MVPIPQIMRRYNSRVLITTHPPEASGRASQPSFEASDVFFPEDCEELP